ASTAIGVLQSELSFIFARLTVLSAGTKNHTFRPSTKNSFSSGDLYSHRIRPGREKKTTPDSAATPPFPSEKLSKKTAFSVAAWRYRDSSDRAIARASRASWMGVVCRISERRMNPSVRTAGFYQEVSGAPFLLHHGRRDVRLRPVRSEA